MYYQRIPINGTCAENNTPPCESPPLSPYIILHGRHNGKPSSFYMTEAQLRRGTLAMGIPRSGKTNFIFSIIRQLVPTLRPIDRLIIFDPRADYFSEFYNDARNDVILSPLLRHRSISDRWNVFLETEYINDKLEKADTFRELAWSLAVDPSATADKFFYEASAQVLNGIFHNIKKMHADADNSMITEIVMGSTFSNRRRELRFDNDPEFGYLESYLGANDAMARDVYAFLNRVVDKYFNTFYGLPNGRFAVSNFIKNKNINSGNILFVGFDVSKKISLGPLNSSILDLAFKSSLSNDRETGNIYFIIDEAPLMHTQYLQSVVDYGAGQGVAVLAGAQNANQLIQQYGQDGGNSLISSFGNLIQFKLNDGVTRGIVQKRFGEVTYEETSTNGYSMRNEIKKGYVVEDATLTSLATGQAVVGICSEKDGSTNPPFIFRFNKY